MRWMIDFVWSLGPWAWFVLAAVMLLLETIIPGVHFMWFGMAAVLLGTLLLLAPFPMPFAVQLIVFAVGALAMILVARRYWSPQSIRTDEPDLNDRGVQYVGRIVTIVEPIVQGRGKVRVGDTVWSAEGPDLPEGAQVKVTGTNGIVLVVAAA